MSEQGLGSLFNAVWEDTAFSALSAQVSILWFDLVYRQTESNQEQTLVGVFSKTYLSMVLSHFS